MEVWMCSECDYYTECNGQCKGETNMVDAKTSYKIKGYSDRWSVIEEHGNYVLMENETYGDETCYLVVNKNATIEDHKYLRLTTGELITIPTIMSQVYETYDDIVTAMEDYDLI